MTRTNSAVIGILVEPATVVARQQQTVNSATGETNLTSQLSTQTKWKALHDGSTRALPGRGDRPRRGCPLIRHTLQRLSEMEMPSSGSCLITGLASGLRFTWTKTDPSCLYLDGLKMLSWTVIGLSKGP
jgi:hypothetical protein